MLRRDARVRQATARQARHIWFRPVGAMNAVGVAENADFLVEIHRVMVYFPDMSQTLEKRVKELETKVAELSAHPVRSNRKKDWRRSIGVFRKDPDFEEAVRLGREYRDQQTYQKEIAGS